MTQYHKTNVTTVLPPPSSNLIICHHYWKVWQGRRYAGLSLTDENYAGRSDCNQEEVRMYPADCQQAHGSAAPDFEPVAFWQNVKASPDPPCYLIVSDRSMTSLAGSQKCGAVLSSCKVQICPAISQSRYQRICNCS